MIAGNTYNRHNDTSESRPTGYKLHKAWFSFALNNPDKVTPTQGILYLYCVELCNSLGWPKTFGLPAALAMASTGIKSYNTYAKTFRELVEFGVIKLITKSKNQYTANIIALSNFNEALEEALYEASTGTHNTASTSAIIPYINNKLETTKTSNIIDNETTAPTHTPDEVNTGDFKGNLPPNDIPAPFEGDAPLNGKFEENNYPSEDAQEKKKGCAKKEKTAPAQFQKPTLEEVAGYCKERNNGVNPEQWLDYYTANGWKVGKNPMKDWKAAVRTWERNGIDNNSQSNGRKEHAASGLRQSSGGTTKKDYGTGTL